MFGINTRNLPTREELVSLLSQYKIRFVESTRKGNTVVSELEPRPAPKDICRKCHGKGYSILSNPVDRRVKQQGYTRLYCSCHNGQRLIAMLDRTRHEAIASELTAIEKQFGKLKTMAAYIEKRRKENKEAA